jgi:hypothetical protein
MYSLFEKRVAELLAFEAGQGDRLDVAASAEGLAAGALDNDQGLFALPARESRVQLADHREIQSVQRFGPVQGDDTFIADVLEDDVVSGG